MIVDEKQIMLGELQNGIEKVYYYWNPLNRTSTLKKLNGLLKNEVESTAKNVGTYKQETLNKTY